MDLTDMRVLSLNQTGMFVLEAIAAGECRPGRLSALVLEEFDADRQTVKRDVEELLADLDRLLGNAATP